jgi:uncharacterized protein YdgA (DUF945 family)
MRKLFITIIASVVLLAVAFPVVMGVWVKHDYVKLITFYNSQGNVHIDIVKYRRFLYSARTQLYVQILHFPQAVTFTVDQRIHYGPFLPGAAIKKIFPLKLAAIHSEFSPAASTAKSFSPAASNAPILTTDDYLTFSGKYSLHFASSGFKWVNTTDEAMTNFQTGPLSGELTLRPGVARFKGKAEAADIIYSTDEITITVPTLAMQFDQHQSSTSKLWIGKSELQARSVTLVDVNGKTILLSNIHTNGQDQENNGKLNAIKKLQIELIRVSDIGVGPLQLQISIQNLKAAPVADLFAAYRDMFYSKEKMIFTKRLLNVLPSLITPETTITIDNLKLQTMDGNVSVTGAAAWPPSTVGTMQNLGDIFHQADAKASMRIAIPLANELLGLAADISFITRRLFHPQQVYFDMLDDLDLLKSQNLLMIGVLTQTKQMEKTAAPKLIAMQNTNVSTDDYLNSLEEFVATHEISVFAQKILKTQYMKIQMAQMPPDRKMAFLESQFADQFDGWLKQGFVTTSDKDYEINWAYQNGVVKMNGKNY